MRIGFLVYVKCKKVKVKRVRIFNGEDEKWSNFRRLNTFEGRSKTLIKYFSKDTVGFYYSQIFDEPKEKNCE